ncbi:MAG: dephospho-CoA kinase [Gammaproteobacteria bacterium HGW-Gammaproteobacteria-8]|nr:MAG: dephospho-CoA kinase [Gammaproteobacteria bacterium HGW-Gammaproteobacteria-8]
MSRIDRSFVVALTGGIASGKTAVSDAFAALGVPVIDTDRIAREVVAPGSPGLAEVLAAFGGSMRAPDGSLDRAALRQVIFTDADARSRLEAILHPRIAAEAHRRMKTVRYPYCILVVPLLVESGLFEDADRILVVDVPESVQIQRLMRRDAADRAQAEAALAAQISREQRLARADEVIDNSGSLAELQAHVAELDAYYRGLANPGQAGLTPD